MKSLRGDPVKGFDLSFIRIREVDLKIDLIIKD